MINSLDKGRLKDLLREADRKWFGHNSKLDYEGHLNFTAAHIAQNYDKVVTHETQQAPTSRRHTDQRQNIPAGQKPKEVAHLF